MTNVRFHSANIECVESALHKLREYAIEIFEIIKFALTHLYWDTFILGGECMFSQISLT